MLRFARFVLGCAGFFAFLCAPASAGIFGTNPIPISVGPNGEGANGPSGGASISGDNRVARLVAFHSDASNLSSRDTNGVRDIFVWERPNGGAGLRLNRPARPSGDLRRVSVSNREAEANGPSSNPSVDGAIGSKPHCVAFESAATNLSSGDTDPTPDIFVRNLWSGRTMLVSDGIGGPATNASIDGDCSAVVFEAEGQVWIARVRGGRPRSLGAGGNPDISMDGSAVVWESGGGVMLRRSGETNQVADGGSSPSVSDEESGLWAVAYNGGNDVYMRVFDRSGGPRKTDLISATRRGGASLGGMSRSGGLTAYAARRGIVTFATESGVGTTLYYRNNNTGNIDDLAHASGAMSEIATSARANFVAFSSTATGFPFDRNGSIQDVFFKHLVDGEAL